MSKAQIQLLNKDVTLLGYSFMYPKDATVRIVKRVHDEKSNKTTFQGIFHHPVFKTCHDVQFDAVTGEHQHFNAADAFGCYNVKVDIDQLEVQ